MRSVNVYGKGEEKGVNNVKPKEFRKIATNAENF